MDGKNISLMHLIIYKTIYSGECFTYLEPYYIGTLIVEQINMVFVQKSSYGSTPSIFLFLAP